MRTTAQDASPSQRRELRQGCLIRGSVCFCGFRSHKVVTADIPENNKLDLVLLAHASLQALEGWELQQILLHFDVFLGGYLFMI